MNALFISTYNSFVRIGLIKNNELTTVVIESDKSHSVNLMPAIITTLEKANIEVEDLNEIIVVNGPGSFTGVRLGVTVAKTLAHTLNVGIKTITSIEAMSLLYNYNKMIVTVPDNKGIYFGIYEKQCLQGELSYLNKDKFDLFIEDYIDYEIVNDDNIDINKIYEYTINKESINPHAVNPVYVKNIEVLSGN